MPQGVKGEAKTMSTLRETMGRMVDRACLRVAPGQLDRYAREEIREIRAAGVSVQHLALEFECDTGTIEEILKGDS